MANDDSSVYLGSPNGYWTYDHNYTCTAQWVQHYSLTYDCNNGVSGQSSIVDNGNLESWDTVTLWHDLGTGFVGDGVNHSNLCTVPDNSTFAGWSCTNATVNNNAITMPSNNVVCTAQWTSNAPTQYTLTYDCNGGTQIDQNTQMVYTYEPNQNYDILGVATLCQRTGYAPNPNGTNVAYSWICQADDDPNEYLTYVHGVWIFTHNYTCRAQWQLVNYLLTYNVPTLSGVTINNAPGSSPVIMPMDTVYTLEPLPTATGYTASGWNCTYPTNNTLTPDSNNQITMPAANVTCSTIWTPNTIGLSWNPNGGSPTPITTPASCVYTSSAGSSGGINNITHPTKTGFTFNGWILTDWDECGLKYGVDTGIDGDGRYAYRDAEDNIETNWEYKLLENQTWAADFTYGAVAGQSICGVEATPSGEDVEFGPICWCRVTSFTNGAGTRCDLIYSGTWQTPYMFGDPEECKNQCAQVCTDNIMINADFRKKMYGNQ